MNATENIPTPATENKAENSTPVTEETKAKYTKCTKPISVPDLANGVAVTFTPTKLKKGSSVVPQAVDWTVEQFTKLFDKNFLGFITESFNSACRVAWIEADENFVGYDDKERSFVSAMRALCNAEKTARVLSSGELLVQIAKTKKAIEAEKDSAKKIELMTTLDSLKIEFKAAKEREDALLADLGL